MPILEVSNDISGKKETAAESNSTTTKPHDFTKLTYSEIEMLTKITYRYSEKKITGTIVYENFQKQNLDGL